MFDLPSYLAEKKLVIETELDARLPGAELRPAVLHQAMRHAACSGGKRLRPILTLAACEAVAGSSPAALLPALAVEIFHAYTLVHDDLPAMDNDELRRGQPTCHVLFGDANAILAGDALLTLAFEWLAEAPPPRNHPATACLLELARAGGHAGVIAGQVEDLAAETKDALAEDVEFIHARKTGALIRAAVRMGAIAGDASPTQLEALSTYGTDIGLAFQIADDILNATSSADVLGKSAGSDEKRGKTTYVAVYGLDSARARAHQLILNALTALEKVEGPTEPLAAIARYFIERTH